MLAVRLHRFGDPDVLTVESVADPRPGPRDLLVQVQATSLNRHDLRLRRGEVGYAVPLPATLGIDVCGVVVETGAEVDGFAPGDRVVNGPWVACETCPSCRQSRSEYCTGGYVYQGSYAELAVVPARIAVTVEDTIASTVLACLPNAYVTAWHMLVERAHIGPGDVAFIWAGTSGLGSAAVEIARIAGATVITTAGSEAKLAALAERGADLCLDHRAPDLVDQVIDLTGGLGATVVFEHVGEATWPRSLQICAPGGTVVSAGATTGKRAALDIADLYHGQRRVVGSRTGTRRDLLGLVRHAAADHLRPLVDSVIPLTHVAEAHRRLEAGSVVGKIVIGVDDPR